VQGTMREGDSESAEGTQSTTIIVAAAVVPTVALVAVGVGIFAWRRRAIKAKSVYRFITGAGGTSGSAGTHPSMTRPAVATV
jgi:hypothetical protein